MTSKLLINEPPLQVLPSLATAIGLNNAIVLQQIHYWTSNPKVGRVYNGRRWVRNSVAEWRSENFPFWSIRTIKRILSDMTEAGYLLTENLNRKKYDRTLWYAIDYAKLPSCQPDTLHSDKLSPSIVTDWHNGKGQNGTMHSDRLAQPIPETLTETHTETLFENARTKSAKHLKADEVIERWQQLTGATIPAEFTEKHRDDYFRPAVSVLKRCGWDVDKAANALQQARSGMIADGLTPRRIAAVVTHAVAELERGSAQPVEVDTDALTSLEMF